MERVRTEADAMASSARVEAERIREEARRISDSLVLEAQTRLEVALRSADEALTLRCNNRKCPLCKGSLRDWQGPI